VAFLGIARELFGKKIPLMEEWYLSLPKNAAAK